MHRPVPTVSSWSFRARWAATRLAVAMRLDLSDALLRDLWLTPWRHPAPSRPSQGADRLTVPARGGPLSAWRYGAGPTVLFVHGWGGRGADGANVAKRLAAAGLSTVAVDLPAHGDTPGRTTTIPAMAAAVRDAVTAIEPEAVVAHSGGACAAVGAFVDGLPSVPFVGLAPMARLQDAADWFAAGVGLPLHGRDRLIALLERDFGRDVLRRWTLDRRIAALPGPALLLHDAHDRHLPATSARALAAAWPRCDYDEVAGVGHRGVLTDAAVLDRVADYLTAQLAPAADQVDSGVA